MVQVRNDVPQRNSLPLRGCVGDSGGQGASHLFVRTPIATPRSIVCCRYRRRPTGIRIDIGLQAEPERFLARLRELDAIAPAVATATRPRVPQLGHLIDAWHASPEWFALRPESRKSYGRVIDPKAGTLRLLLQRPLREFKPAFLLSLRDAVARRHGQWLGNYTVKVLRVAFAWGRLRGWCETNPAVGVPLLPKPVGAPQRNRAWTPDEFEQVSMRAGTRLRLAIALAYFGGLRVGDVVSVQWPSWNGSVLSLVQSKTSEPVHIVAPAPLRTLLEQTPREGATILVNESRQRYTRDGLQSNLWRLVKTLEAEGVVAKGLCFHGLRHSLGATLYNLGVDREARKAALGHTSDAASAVYERDGNRRAAAQRAYDALDADLRTRAERDANAPRTNLSNS